MINSNAFRTRKDGKPTTRCYCATPRLIENYEKAIADNTQVWECHHKAEICYSRKELIEKGDYYNVPPCNLIFLTPVEHNRLHSRDRVKSRSEEWKRKLSDALKKYKRTPEHQKRLNESHIGKGVVKKPLKCIETKIVYESVYEASHKTNVCSSGIYRCCIGKRKSAGGFHWEYIGE